MAQYFQIACDQRWQWASSFALHLTSRFQETSAFIDWAGWMGFLLAHIFQPVVCYESHSEWGEGYSVETGYKGSHRGGGGCFYAVASASDLLKLSYRLVLVCWPMACRKLLNQRCCIYWTVHKIIWVKFKASINILSIYDSGKKQRHVLFAEIHAHMLVLVICVLSYCASWRHRFLFPEIIFVVSEICATGLR